MARYAKDAPVSDLTRILGKNLNYTFLYKKNSYKKQSPLYVSLSSKKHFITFFYVQENSIVLPHILANTVFTTPLLRIYDSLYLVRPSNRLYGISFAG